MSNGGQSRSSSYFHFAAGLSSGVLSAILLQPADLLKTRIQQSRSSTLSATLRDILNSPHPVRQLWRGTTPSTLRTGFGSALYFTTLNALRQSVAKAALLSQGSPEAAPVGPSHSSSLPKLSNTANLVTGAVARSFAGFVMMPITVIKVRYESSFYNYNSLLSAGRSILATDGVRGFFAGFGATTVRDAPYAGLYVLFYEQSKRRLSRWAGTPRNTGKIGSEAGNDAISSRQAAIINFGSGVIAAGLGTTLTNPFDAIKTRIQLMPHKYGNMLLAARLIVREDGPRALFDGLGLRIARKAMASALAWTVYEELIRRAEVRAVGSA